MLLNPRRSIGRDRRAVKPRWASLLTRALPSGSPGTDHYRFTVALVDDPVLACGLRIEDPPPIPLGLNRVSLRPVHPCLCVRAFALSRIRGPVRCGLGLSRRWLSTFQGRRQSTFPDSTRRAAPHEPTPGIREQPGCLGTTSMGVCGSSSMRHGLRRQIPYMPLPGHRRSGMLLSSCNKKRGHLQVFS